MAFKQKKRGKNIKNRYLKPGALAQIRYSRASSKPCTDISRKRVVLQSKESKTSLLCCTQLDIDVTPMASPSRIEIDASFSYKSPLTPKTPATPKRQSTSILESLPMDLLVKILCNLHHDQLKPLFHVSQRIRKAVLLARQYHFNYRTPDRSRQEMLNSKTPLPTDHWPFIRYYQQNSTPLRSNWGKTVKDRTGNCSLCSGGWGMSPRTPRAPRHANFGHRFQLMDMSQIAAVLFPKPACKDDLCRAVAHKKLH
ncbi:F-box family protein isoform X1 [Wolffia australiana]